MLVHYRLVSFVRTTFAAHSSNVIRSAASELYASPTLPVYQCLARPGSEGILRTITPPTKLRRLLIFCCTLASPAAVAVCVSIARWSSLPIPAVRFKNCHIHCSNASMRYHCANLKAIQTWLQSHHGDDPGKCSQLPNLIWMCRLLFIWPNSEASWTTLHVQLWSGIANFTSSALNHIYQFLVCYFEMSALGVILEASLGMSRTQF